jgi:ABC-type polysaccharide/polyol phosphate export permease
VILAELGNAWSYRELVAQLTLRNVKAGRKQSLLGLSWIVIQPLVQTAIFTLVFSYLLGMESGGRPYPVFVFAGILTWGFLANATTVASTSVVNNAGLVTKTWFPRETLVYAATCSCGINLLVNTLVLAAMIAVFRFAGEPVEVGPGALWLAPIAGIVALLAQGIGMFAAALGVIWRDVHSILPLGMQVWFFATPIVYPLARARENLPAWAWKAYQLNPMVGIVTSVRSILLEGGMPDYRMLGLAALVSAAVFLLGFVFFKKCEPHFADLV